MKRVLLITDVTAPGGLDTYILDLQSAAESAGWDMSVLMDHSNGSDALADQLRRRGCVVRRAGLYHRASTEDERRVAVREAIGATKPDVAHVVCPAPWTTVVPREAILEVGVPLVFVEQYTERGMYLEPGILDRLSRIYRECRSAIVVSEESACTLADLGLPRDRMTVIPNSIRVDAPFERVTPERVFADWRVPDRAVRAVSVARLHPNKGLDLLVEALALLPGSERSSFHITIFGEGPQRASLEGLIASRGVGDAITLAGWTDNPRRYLAAFDLFVLPSRAEGLPFALLEALAEGLPAIVTDAGGNREVVEALQAGTVVPVEAPAALAEAIATFVRVGTQAASPQTVMSELRRLYDLDTNLARTMAFWD